MLGWLVDHAVLLYVLLGFVGLLLFVLWWQNRTRRYLVALGGVALLAALVFLLTLLVVSDRQNLDRTIRRMGGDLEKRRVPDFFQNISKSFKHNSPPLDAAGFREYVARNLKAYDVKGFRVDKVEVDQLVPKEKAKVSFRIQVDLPRDERPPPMRCDAEFVWENERWCLQSFKLFYANLGNEFNLPP